MKTILLITTGLAIAVLSAIIVAAIAAMLDRRK